MIGIIMVQVIITIGDQVQNHEIHQILYLKKAKDFGIPKEIQLQNPSLIGFYY